jgi:hypothetical protein
MKKGKMKRGLFIVLGLIFVFSLAIVSSITLNNLNNLQECKLTCKGSLNESNVLCNSNYNHCKENCTGRFCNSVCFKEKWSCLKNSTADYKICIKDCAFENKKVCLNVTNYTKPVVNGCDICKCSRNGKANCKRDAFCNKNLTISENLCKNNGGLYQSICNGPYFDIVCSQQKFCICGGNFNYPCPENYECFSDFVSPNKRTHTIGDWKTILGVPLGDIGVCAKNY